MRRINVRHHFERIIIIITKDESRKSKATVKENKIEQLTNQLSIFNVVYTLFVSFLFLFVLLCAFLFYNHCELLNEIWSSFGSSLILIAFVVCGGGKLSLWCVVFENGLVVGACCFFGGVEDAETLLFTSINLCRR